MNDNNPAAARVAAAPQEKHVRLHHAVKRIESLSRHVDMIADRVTGEDRMPTPAMPALMDNEHVAPPLLDVLEQVPGYLDDHINAIESKLDRLNDLLF